MSKHYPNSRDLLDIQKPVLDFDDRGKPKNAPDYGTAFFEGPMSIYGQPLKQKVVFSKDGTKSSKIYFYSLDAPSPGLAEALRRFYLRQSPESLTSRFEAPVVDDASKKRLIEYIINQLTVEDKYTYISVAATNETCNMIAHAQARKLRKSIENPQMLEVGIQTDEEYGGMGIAKESLDQTIKIAKKKGVKYIQIYTTNDNDNVVKLVNRLVKKYPIAFEPEDGKAGSEPGQLKCWIRISDEDPSPPKESTKDRAKHHNNLMESIRLVGAKDIEKAFNTTQPDETESSAAIIELTLYGPNICTPEPSIEEMCRKELIEILIKEDPVLRDKHQKKKKKKGKTKQSKTL